VEINKLVAMKEGTKGQAYNCASGINVTIKELAEKVRSMLDKDDIEIVYENWAPGDIKVFQVDNTKIKSLGFNFKTIFDEGLRNTVSWLKEYLGKGE